MPEEVELCFFGTQFLYKFARCVITGVSVNHAALGMASFFAQDGAPTAVELTIQLEEIETLTKQAYGTPNTVVQATTAGANGAFSGVTGDATTTYGPSDITVTDGQTVTANNGWTNYGGSTQQISFNSSFGGLF
jgi:hypothetical protein